MSLVFAGIMSHGPGMTARAERADPAVREPFYAALGRMRDALERSRPDALIVIAAEHFANFFMNNMPAYAMGMAEEYEGPIEDPDWLRIARRTIPGAPDLSSRIIGRVMDSVDVAYAEEWKFDHGIMVPLNFLTPRFDLPVIPANINCQGPPLTPLHRAYEFGRAIRAACDAVPERSRAGRHRRHLALARDSQFGEDQRRMGPRISPALGPQRSRGTTSYTDSETLRDAGQGGFEIRTLIAAAGACEGGTGELWFCEPIPIFATSGFVAVMDVGAAAEARAA